MDAIRLYNEVYPANPIPTAVAENPIPLQTAAPRNPASQPASASGFASGPASGSARYAQTCTDLSITDTSGCCIAHDIC